MTDARRPLPADVSRSSANHVAPPRLGLVPTSPSGEVDDAGLAKALATGQLHAHAIAFDRFANLVRGLLRRSLGAHTDIDDRLQDVFLELFKSAKTLRDPSALRSFVVGITVRVARSELRRRRFRRWLSLSDTGALPETIDEGVDEAGREALRRLEALLDDLDTEDRLLFVLRFVESLELTEAADALGISLATAKRRLSKITSRVHARASRDVILSSYLSVPAEQEEHDA